VLLLQNLAIIGKSAIINTKGISDCRLPIFGFFSRRFHSLILTADCTDFTDFFTDKQNSFTLPFFFCIIQHADAPLRKRLEELVRDVKPVLLSTLPESESLSEAFLRENVVPVGKPEDARHVAIALVYGLDVLVSWNFRHIVNIRREERFNAVALLEGYHHYLRIVSPKELIYDDEIS